MRAPTLLISAAGRTEKAEINGLVTSQGFNTCCANGNQHLSKIIEDHEPRLAIACHTQNGARNGLNTIKLIRKIRPAVPIILIAKNSTESLAIKAIKAGVSDYLKYPFENDDLLLSIRQHIPSKTPDAAIGQQADDAHHNSGQSMVCTSRQMVELKAYLSKLAATDCTVLITGETGTGKELAAERIHRQSCRHPAPFVCVNCAALPENLVESELFGYEKGAFTGAVESKIGKFGQADGGTLFLDEIGDMSPFAQAKLLRTIEGKQVCPIGGQKPQSLDMRIIAATNQDLKALIAENKFRQDLYYRLNVALVHLPPLRQRREDIPALVDHAILKLNRSFNRNVKHVTGRAMETLSQYPWPGNVRELLNALESSYVNLTGDQIDQADLPRHLTHPLDPHEEHCLGERTRIVSALMETTWNKSAAAQKLNWSRMTLYRKMRRYNIVENRNSAK
jgi:DNA-binding NtrC family response regulator